MKSCVHLSNQVRLVQSLVPVGHHLKRFMMYMTQINYQNRL